MGEMSINPMAEPAETVSPYDSKNSSTERVFIVSQDCLASAKSQSDLLAIAKRKAQNRARKKSKAETQS